MLRTLTFWLRPDFLLRVLNRFQKVAGFDRSMGMASSALTAIIPLAVVATAILPHVGGKDAAQRIIDRYDLTGGGAEAVKDVFSPATDTSTSLGIIGVLFLIVAVLSFTRSVSSSPLNSTVAPECSVFVSTSPTRGGSGWPVRNGAMRHCELRISAEVT